METSNWLFIEGDCLLMFLLWSISTLGLINSFILEPAFIRKRAKSLEFIKIDETDFLLPSWQKKGRSCKEGSVSDWETSSLTWNKVPYIMQNTKNRETDSKGYWDILNSGTISSFILVLSWHQSPDVFISLQFSFPYFIPCY